MDTHIKGWVGWALVFALVVSSISFAVYVHSYGANATTSNRTFTVSAEGKAVAVPDVAEFTFSVISEGSTNLSDLQKNNTDRVNKVTAFLKDKKVDDKDVSTVGYSVDPRYQYSTCNNGQCPPPQIVGYTVTQTTRVKARDFSVVGDLLSGVVQQGANSVSSLSFTQDDPEKAKNDARADAMKKARAQAQMISNAGGFSLGRLVSVSEEGAPGPIPYGVGGAASDSGFKSMVAPQASSAPVVQPGSQDVTIDLALTYEIR
jgi:uncharacterized protein YggE